MTGRGPSGEEEALPEGIRGQKVVSMTKYALCEYWEEQVPLPKFKPMGMKTKECRVVTERGSAAG